MHRSTLLSLSLSLALIPAWAFGAVLQPPTISNRCQVNTTLVQGQQACDLSGTPGASSEVLTSPLVLLSTEARAGFGTVQRPFDGGTATGDARLTYQFQVTGGTAGDVVPIIISLYLDTMSVGPTNSYGFATLTVQNASGTGLRTVSACTTPGANGCPLGSQSTFSGEITMNWTSGTVGRIHLQALAAATSGPEPILRSARAVADPYIYIDPAFANASLYTVSVSSGVANVPTVVPEPAAGWLVVTGLGFVWRWRRRG